MTSFGWNCRRFSVFKRNGRKEVEVSKQNGDDWLSSYREECGGIGTFTEVVKKDQKCDEIEKVCEMSWNSKDNEDIWLSKCDVGVIKEFGNVSVGEGPFLVKINEDAASVEPAWMESFLGLSMVPSRAVQSPLLILEEKGSPLPTQHGSRKNEPQNERLGCDRSIPFKSLQTGHRGKCFGGFKDLKVGFRKVDGKFVDSKQKLASPSLPIIGLGRKKKSQEEKVSVSLMDLSPVLTLNWSSYLAVKGQVMKCRNSKNNLKLSLNFEDEISRIIRIGVDLGMDFDGKKVGMTAVFAEVKRKLKL
ncbi:hypothetical protein LWI28_004974 [Acer negundo]|uniref:Uncharacterized protein n=1 Tax=Acer negundo TaxID=4023 RepID=A0AAD5JGV5_ACENE|nr:hypothetical protein LWI28_004974 [Acer negundo]